MNFWDYCKDRMAEGVIWLAVMIFTGIFLHTLGIGNDGVIFLMGLLLLGYGAPFVLSYWKRRRFFSQTLDRLDHLEEAYLLTEMLPEAGFLEGELFCDILRQCSKSMNDRIGLFRRESRDYREYVETWIHEVKTPLASARLSLDNAPRELSRRVERELSRLDQLLEQALYYARSSSTEKDYLVRKIPLRELVNASLRKNSRDFIDAHVSVKTENLDNTVYTDSKWAGFILDQIFQNAVKYRKKDGAQVAVSARESSGAVVLQIADNGIGIPAADLGRIFEKGFTGENGRKYEKSTGIGLYLCRKLCQKLNMGIRAQSREGEGAVFFLSFPKSEYAALLDENSTFAKP